ncbi:DUF1236 domain-containing protein [Phreatobacter sp.]|uniref:DUF1236 domain-containing protein n=1 Tax=Phreatobacter sp. TaxID=1966341 RepID=UPI003F71338F
MKKTIIASAFIVALSGGAWAQGPADTTGSRPNPSAAQTTGSIPNARMEVIRNFWTTERPRAVVLPDGMTMSRGAMVPPAVELNTFPQTVDAPYRYVVVGNQMYLVDPADRRVVYIMQQ